LGDPRVTVPEADDVYVPSDPVQTQLIPVTTF